MAIDYFRSDGGEPFRNFVRRVLFHERLDVIVDEYWEASTQVLYVALSTFGGNVTAQIFQDRGEAMIGGARHRGLMEFSEAENPSYIHCSENLIAKLTPTSLPQAKLWRNRVIEWWRTMEALLNATGRAEAGDRITMIPIQPGSNAPHYEAVVTAYRSIEPVPESSWPNFHGAVDLLATGYVVMVRKNLASS